MQYDSLDEAVNRLSGTFVTFDKKPVYISEIGGGPKQGLTANCWPFPFNGDQQFIARLDAKEFNHFQPPPLGFCNFFGGDRSRLPTSDCYWCERTPARQRRQGLSGDTFSAVSLASGHSIQLGYVQNSQAFLEMVLGEYPTHEEVIQRLIPSSSIAVSREFAIRMSEGGYLFLYYKKDEIGIFLRGQLYIRSDRQYMMESIIENPNLPDRVEVM